MDYPREPLGLDHFSGLGNLAGDALLPLQRLLNRSRGQLNGGAYFVHPSLDGAFPTIADAKDQADKDERDVVIFQVAKGFTHLLPTPKFDADKPSSYFFTTYPQERHDFFNSRTAIQGTIDSAAVDQPAANLNHVIGFERVRFTGDVTAKRGRSIYSHNSIFANSRVFLEQGAGVAADAPRASFSRCAFNGSFDFDVVDSPASPQGSLNLFFCRLLMQNTFGAPLKIGHASTLRIANTTVDLGVFADGVAVIDFENGSARIEMEDTTFLITQIGVTAVKLYGNEASGTVKYKGNVRLYDAASFGAVPVDFGTPGTIEGSPAVDTKSTPTNPPLGTDRKDRGATETWLSWNGSTWA